MSDQLDPAEPLGRRALLRGSAVAAAAAGAGVLATAAGAPSARAAVPDPVLLGTDNSTTTTTSVAVDRADGPALTLTNPSGASLKLTCVPDTWGGTIDLGEVVNTTQGPAVGVDFGAGAEMVFLLNTRDLDALPVTMSLPPTRIVDTRWVNKSITIVQSSPDAFDSSRRLKAGAWMDVAIAAADEGFDYISAFVNLTVVTPGGRGYLAAYPPGDGPVTSTLNYEAGVSIANGAFVSLGPVGSSFAVRVYTSATTHVLLDVTGVIVRTDQTETASTTAKRASIARESRRPTAGRILRRLRSLTG